MKRFILILFITTVSFSQNINDYKYALVPAKYDFLKSKDLYGLNTLTKMFMQKYGFETYLDSEILPADFAGNNCNKVFVSIENNSSLFITKLKVVLKDCKNTVLFISDEGRSKEKEYKVAYTQALRQAFASFDKLNYRYQPSEKSLEMVSEPVKQNRTEEKVAVIKEDVKVANSNETIAALFAQPITNGFQLINTEPKVIYKIFKTSTKDFFIATKETTQGVFFSRNNEWFFEYYQNDKLVSEKVEVKF